MGIKRPTRARSAALHVPGDSPGPLEDLAPLILGRQAQVRLIKTGLRCQQVALFSSPITPLFARWHPVCFGRVPSPTGQAPGGVLYVCGLVFPPTSLLKASSDRARNDKLAMDGDREAALTFVARDLCVL
ncbi:hypothetical protein ROHU_016779 [Labeo rohita]|uniref:Uncharacterized protein n=1 Tax=Labeo rohita TaxID=84645 RepID=A0A498NID9_LABRO|nr:hypothetical protein ROHU_016779 [Labeo rohita]